MRFTLISAKRNPRKKRRSKKARTRSKLYIIFYMKGPNVGVYLNLKCMQRAIIHWADHSERKNELHKYMHFSSGSQTHSRTHTCIPETAEKMKFKFGYKIYSLQKNGITMIPKKRYRDNVQCIDGRERNERQKESREMKKLKMHRAPFRSRNSSANAYVRRHNQSHIRIIQGMSARARVLNPTNQRANKRLKQA